MNLFIFGINGEKECDIKAKDMETAIKVFKVDELFPEVYVDKKYIVKDKEGHYDRDYDNDLSRYHYKFKDNPQIVIHEFDSEKGRYYQTPGGSYKRNKPLSKKSISLSECVVVDFQMLNPVPLIGFDSNETEEDEGEKQELIEVTTELLEGTGIPLKAVSAYSKTEMRQIHDMVIHKRAELERYSEKLRGIIVAFEKEISIKKKMIYMISTYLGIEEVLLQLKEGEKAKESEPLSIFQMKLFMDEEIGIWEDGGLAVEDIKKFDKWISSKGRFKKFLYKEKSVCAFQVRRKDKKYSENAWDNMRMNEGNNNTYFLIRNGDNLYRIWSDVHIVYRMFPTLTEYENILNEYKGSFIEKQQEKVQSKHESYMYGLIAIQGLIERTDIFGHELKSRVNLMKINGFSEEDINLIRDDESNMWITDGMLSWRDYVKRNQESVKVGTRIIFMEIEHRRYSCGEWRTEPFKPDDLPNTKEIYIVEDDAEYLESKWNKYGDGLKITYLPNDTVYNIGWEYDPHERKNKVPYRFYKTDVLNYDDITVEECEHFENNRFERPDYLGMLPVLHWIKKAKQEEEKLENEFIKFIKPQLLNTVTDDEIKKTILWWKLKNKWKRGLMTDDAKAVRMIVKKLNKKEKTNE